MHHCLSSYLHMLVHGSTDVCLRYFSGPGGARALDGSVLGLTVMG